jgi:hypothetical protein
MDFVKDGGHLLITGSMERDDRWRRTRRLHDLGIDSVTEPLNFHAGEMRVGEQAVTVQFSGPRQLTLESLGIAGGWAEKAVGKGTVYIAAYPVELADGPEAAKAVYTAVLNRLGLQSPFEGALPSGVLARPVTFADSILYLLVSESANEHEIDLKDRLTGGRIRLHLAAQHSVLLLLDRKTGTLLAKSD